MSVRIRVNGEEREVEAGTTVLSLVRSLDLRPELVAVELNRALVGRMRHASTELTDGDVVEVVTLVGGG